MNTKDFIEDHKYEKNLIIILLNCQYCQLLVILIKHYNFLKVGN